MKVFKKSLCLLLVATMLFTVFASTMITASAAPFTIQRQWETKWKSVYVGGRSLYQTACGIFSIVNAVGYLTGDAPYVVDAAKWANSIGGFNTPSAGGTFRTTLYPRLQGKYGNTYGFTVDCGSGNTGYWSTAASSTLKAHLANGGVAIGHVPGHFIALVGYDYATNKFHVYDSAPSSSRGTATYGVTGLGDCWVTQSRLSTGKLDLDWFCLLSRKGGGGAVSNVNWTTGDYSLLGNKYLRDSASTSANTILTVPSGTVLQVYEIVNNSFGKTQYGDSVGYITLDEDTKRISDFIHGGATITSDGMRYPNSPYTASWVDVQGIAGFHYKVTLLDGAPAYSDGDVHNASVDEPGTVIVDETKYLYRYHTSVTIPAEKMVNGKYLKIAVEAVFPNNISHWNCKYVSCSELPYTDVFSYDWYYAYVLYAYNQNYLGGVETNTFAPHNGVDKAQLASVLYRMAGSPAHKGSALPYTDISTDEYYYDALVWCYENKIFASSTKFNPKSTISREDAVMGFHKFAVATGEDTYVNNFVSILYYSDAMSINSGRYNEFAWAVEKDIIHCNDKNCIIPGTKLTRAELASAIANYDANVRNK